MKNMSDFTKVTLLVPNQPFLQIAYPLERLCYHIEQYKEFKDLSIIYNLYVSVCRNHAQATYWEILSTSLP